MEWISVDDRYPDKSSELYIIFDNGEVDVGFLNRNCTFEYYACGSNQGLPEVTHWMAFPEPPKGG